MASARRWLADLVGRFVAWLLCLDDADYLDRLILHDGSQWHPQSVRGMALVCRGENGHSRLVRRSDCRNADEFDRYAEAWGMFRRVCWEDGTKASDDPPAI